MPLPSPIGLPSPCQDSSRHVVYDTFYCGGGFAGGANFGVQQNQQNNESTTLCTCMQSRCQPLQPLPILGSASKGQGQHDNQPLKIRAGSGRWCWCWRSDGRHDSRGEAGDEQGLAGCSGRQARWQGNGCEAVGVRQWVFDGRNQE